MTNIALEKGTYATRAIIYFNTVKIFVGDIDTILLSIIIYYTAEGAGGGVYNGRTHFS